ncbi:hypothetical protein KEM54_002171 [Ascosphaera aggregata]|nr:hypothetical protein KEM54_002171 [Ascosphaera aggregata]
MSLSNSTTTLSLTDVAAQITCLFWFETVAKLSIVEGLKSSDYNTPPLLREALPSRQFRAWLATVLNTTQVSRNVILLALLFVYRLKRTIPWPRGKKGSEHRLLSVALMLGNKYLDDNTYTNKTWADVCGMNVEELHQMEVEFLGHLRYNLFVSEKEWYRWEEKLSIFLRYIERATQLPFENDLPTTPTAPNLPPTFYYPTTAAAAPGSLMAAAASQQLPHLDIACNSSCGTQYIQKPTQSQSQPQQPQPPPPPLQQHVPPVPNESGDIDIDMYTGMSLSRKRPLDNSVSEHPTKRFAPSSSSSSSSSSASSKQNLPSAVRTLSVPVVDSALPTYNLPPSGMVSQQQPGANIPPSTMRIPVVSQQQQQQQQQQHQHQHQHPPPPPPPPPQQQQQQQQQPPRTLNPSS